MNKITNTTSGYIVFFKHFALCIFKTPWNVFGIGFQAFFQVRVHVNTVSICFDVLHNLIRSFVRRVSSVGAYVSIVGISRVLKFAVLR